MGNEAFYRYFLERKVLWTLLEHEIIRLGASSLSSFTPKQEHERKIFTLKKKEWDGKFESVLVFCSTSNVDLPVLVIPPQIKQRNTASHSLTSRKPIVLREINADSASPKWFSGRSKPQSLFQILMKLLGAIFTKETETKNPIGESQALRLCKP